MNIEVSKPMAKLFYEQCAGTYGGHMGNVPNNPTLFGLVGAHSSEINNSHASTQEEFAEFLRSVADGLTN